MCQANKDSGSDSLGNNGGGDSKPGDRTCECGDTYLASRTECVKCKLEKPEGSGGGDGDDKFNTTSNNELHIPANAGANDSSNNGISITDFHRNAIPKACTSFKEVGLNDLLLENIAKCNYTQPTPLQQHGIPIIAADRDLMAWSQKGSGQKAAFLLPIINKL